MRLLYRAAARCAAATMAASLWAGPLLALAPATVAAASPNAGAPVHVALTRHLDLSAAECLALGTPAARRAPGQPSSTCPATMTMELDALPVARPSGQVQAVSSSGPQALLSGSGSCRTTWIISSLRATVQSILWGVFWSASANATGYGDSCGRVMWTSVTCDAHGIGFTVRVDWCGAYPGAWRWYGYTSTNMGLNITVSAVTDGAPVSFTHGARNGFNPYTGAMYGFFAW